MALLRNTITPNKAQYDVGHLEIKPGELPYKERMLIICHACGSDLCCSGSMS